MIRINVNEVLSRAEEEKRNPKPLPNIRVKSKSQSVQEVEEQAQREYSPLLKTLWAEFSALKNERNKLSTEISYLVENGAGQARLKEQYDRIESFRPRLQDLYDKIHYVEKHGELPSIPDTSGDPPTVASLKLKKEALIDERYKLRKKLERKRALNPQRFIDWELRLAQADMEYHDIVNQIKKMEGKA